MKKGQISLDLVISIVSMLVIIGALNAITTTYIDSGEISNTTQQLELAVNTTANIINEAQILSDTNFRVETKVPKIKYKESGGESKTVYPKVEILIPAGGLIDPKDEILDGNIKLSVIYDGKTQSAVAPIYKQLDTRIILDTTQTDGSVVITNE
ncbi:MAG: hypothetical protein NTY48_06595 [Candidatus Diapherotrites archaeon]|nr:hypothetical protein [Candidatus Diapherotrites archaeon]